MKVIVSIARSTRGRRVGYFGDRFIARESRSGMSRHTEPLSPPRAFGLVAAFGFTDHLYEGIDDRPSLGPRLGRD
jgi:hypothetical protein